MLCVKLSIKINLEERAGGMYYYWELVVTFSKYVLEAISGSSWPIAVFAIAWIFRDKIDSLIDRIKQISGLGAAAEFSPGEKYMQQEEKVNAFAFSTAQSSPGMANLNNNERPPNSDPVFDILDNQLRETLEQQFHQNCEIKLAWAIRMRSISEATRMHESNYRLIFGSQIKALKLLNAHGVSNIGDFKTFYENVRVDPANEIFHKDRSFEHWGKFLVSINYVKINDGSERHTVEITPLGKQFLQWMVLYEVSEFKPG